MSTTRPSILESTDYLIGIDDTDVIGSRGTGRLSQLLIAELREQGLGRALGATRHQLLVDPRIPYTSHNSSACIAWDAEDIADRDALVAAAAAFLVRESADGADPGLAVVDPAALDAEQRARLVAYGASAKTNVLDQPTARMLAADLGIHLSGHGGTEDGVIGSLAATGLHLSGGDGLFLWMEGIRQLDGTCTYAELQATVPIDDAAAPDGSRPAPGDEIILGDWVRPILAEGRALLLLDQPEQEPGGGVTSWRVSPRDVVKRH